MQMDDFLVIDLETTGLGSDAEICEIAIINKAGDTLLHALVNPTHGIPTEASSIHGITPDRVKNASPFHLLWPSISWMLETSHVIAYNAEFEERILRQCAGEQRHSVDLVANWHCAMKAYAKHYGDWNPRFKSYKWKSLDVACKEFGIQLDNAHSALDDARATLAVVKALAALEDEPF